MSGSSREAKAAPAAGRREFLGALGAAGVAAAGGLPGPAGALEGGNSAGAGDYDVIVIGGGFCGITAARECRRAGYRTLVLEARNRLGGRTHTADFDGRPVDMGGTYVHWFQPHVWAEIRRSGVALAESSGAVADRLVVHTSRDDIAELSSAKMSARIEQAVAAYMGDARAALPRPHDPFASEAYRRLDGISSAERLASLKGVDALTRDVLDGNFASSGHNYSERFAYLEMVRWFSLSGHNVADEDDATSRYHFRDGTVALLDFVLAEGRPEVRLGTPVRRVVEDGAHVAVVTAGGETIAARALVSTVPLNVLKDLDWQPPLAEARLQASQETHAGHGTKIHVVLEGELGDMNCIAPSRHALNYLCTESKAGSDTYLVGFGPDPALLDVHDPESVQRAVRLFLPRARVVRSLGYDWTADPYSQGTWCTLRPGMWSRYLRALQQPTARIVFASSDWANGWRGFIDGAIEQGLEAGRRVRALLG